MAGNESEDEVAKAASKLLSMQKKKYSCCKRELATEIWEEVTMENTNTGR